MSPSTRGMGQSPVTLDKQDGLRCILRQHANTSKHIISKHPDWYTPTYWYVDTTAGCGYNEQVQCSGSPLIFLDEIERTHLDYRGIFIELDPVLAGLLKDNLRQSYSHVIAAKPGQIAVVAGDNREWLPKVCDLIPDGSFGLGYHDPNGEPDIDLLSTISTRWELRRFDLLVRYNSTAVKRNAHRSGRDLLGDISRISKTYLMVRRILPSDPWRWTFLYFSNWDGMTAWRSKGFVYADSAEGLQTLERLALTNEEYDRVHSPELPWQPNTGTIQNISQPRNLESSDVKL